MQDNQRQADWAYIAGVMDSDGCFMITRHKRQTKNKQTERGLAFPKKVTSWSWSYLPAVKICQIQPEAVYFIKNEFGYGTITLGGARPSRPNSLPIFQWGIRKISDLVPFLESIMPYLKIKKNRAEFLLNYCKTVKRQSGYLGISGDELAYREESYQKMRELNVQRAAAETNPQVLERVK